MFIAINYLPRCDVKNFDINGTVKHIEKARINDHLRDSNISWKFRISTINSVTVFCP